MASGGWVFLVYSGTRFIAATWTLGRALVLADAAPAARKPPPSAAWVIRELADQSGDDARGRLAASRSWLRIWRVPVAS
jgi:hypothetical protein